MLDQSISDLHETVSDLEDKYKEIDNEGNEWQTRHVICIDFELDGK